MMHVVSYNTLCIYYNNYAWCINYTFSARENISQHTPGSTYKTTMKMDNIFEFATTQSKSTVEQPTPETKDLNEVTQGKGSYTNIQAPTTQALTSQAPITSNMQTPGTISEILKENSVKEKDHPTTEQSEPTHANYEQVVVHTGGVVWGSERRQPTVSGFVGS